ncbi:MAG: N-acetylmuramoyl-L-alanine amidase [Thermodesulfobacteriota bacterium]
MPARNKAIFLILFGAVTLLAPRPACSQDRFKVFPVVEWVVLDPGHGGEDQGVVGPGGWTEAQLTLALARQLKEALERDLGLHVVVTRDEELNPGLYERTATANGLKADLFLSLHAAAEAYDNRFGYNIFVQDYRRQLGLADREPRADLMPGQLGEWSLAQMTYLDSSRRLARELDQSLKEVLRVRSRGVQGLPLALLAGAAQPAVLLEVGVLTDPEAERRLRTPGYRDALTRAVVQGLGNWLHRVDEEFETGPPAEDVD